MAKLSFEENMTRLEQIVRALEKGDAPLEDSLKLFQEGTELVRSCEKQLDEAQMHVAKVLAGENGAPMEVPFHEDV